MIYLSALIASLHYLGLGIGLGSIYARARAFANLRQDAGAMPRVLSADNFWGISALLLLGSGLLRAFGGFEKGSSFYLGSGFFHLKMGLFLLILVLELAPMLTLIRWRLANRRQSAPPLSARQIQRYTTFSWIELGLLLAMMLSASLMARLHF